MSLKKLIEDKRKVKSKKEKSKVKKNIAVGAGVGILAGITGGLLFAPKKGEETREQLKTSVNNLTEVTKNKTSEAKTKISEYLKEKKEENARLKAAIIEDSRINIIEDDNIGI